MSNKITTAKIVVALDEHRLRTIENFEATILPYINTLKGPGLPDLNMLIDKYRSSLRDLETKLEELL